MCAEGYGLGRVDYRSAAYGQYKVRCFAPCYVDTLVYGVICGIGSYSFLLYIRYAGFCQRGAYLVEQTALFRTPASAHDQHLGASVTFYKFAGLVLCVAAENEFCG